MDRNELDKALATFAQQVGALNGLNASAVLYGSAARGDWIPGRSDVNLLLVVDDTTPEALRRLTPVVTDWHTRGFLPPLIIGRGEWDRSVDVFPIEITDMQLSHRVLCGTDPVRAMVVDPADLREGVERELRGKLVRLRQAYVRFGESGVILGGFAATSVPTFFALLRCIAVLFGREPGRERRDTVRALAAELGADGEAAISIAEHRKEPDWNCSPELFVRYMDLVCKTVNLVDNFQRGDA